LDVSDPYLDALKMLARQEISESRLRERLARRGHPAATIDQAVSRLKEERAIDDVRVAQSIARTEAAVKHRGRHRVKRRIEHAGIARATASRAVDDVFVGIDEEALLEASLAKRLRRRASIEDDADFARLYRYLIMQGFDPDRVMNALTARRRRKP
jgi:regulatory protein